MTDRKSKIKEAADAMADLYTFNTIISILEGGNLHAASHDAAQKIIRICKNQMQKRLAEFDAASAAACQ